MRRSVPSAGPARRVRTLGFRTCVGCGERVDRAVLVRIVVEDDRVIVDRERRGGRGAWLHAREACLATALKRRAIIRALRLQGAGLDEAALRAGLTGIARQD